MSYRHLGLSKGRVPGQQGRSPYIVAAHNPIAYYGINAYILRKEQKLTEEIIDDIAKAYRQVYQCGTSVENALLRIKGDHYYRTGNSMYP